MKQPILWVFSLIVLLLPSVSFAYSYPGAATGYVNDFATVLSQDQKSTIEQELSQFQASTTNEIAVVTIKSLEGDTIENYATKLFEDWKIGSKTHDNGILFLVAVNDHKVRLEVGYGLEGAVPDATANAIIQHDILPRFKANDYGGGIESGVSSIMKASQYEYQTTTSHTNTSFFTLLINNFFYVLIFGALIVQWLASILGRSKSWWLGGIVGGVVGLISLFFFSTVLALSISFGLGLLGLLFDYIVSNTYTKSLAGGNAHPWWIGGNGFSSGPGGSSGGFGGFGGGSSGGGGASGSW